MSKRESETELEDEPKTKNLKTEEWIERNTSCIVCTELLFRPQTGPCEHPVCLFCSKKLQKCPICCTNIPKFKSSQFIERMVRELVPNAQYESAEKKWKREYTIKGKLEYMKESFPGLRYRFKDITEDSILKCLDMFLYMTKVSNMKEGLKEIRKKLNIKPLTNVFFVKTNQSFFNFASNAVFGLFTSENHAMLVIPHYDSV